MRKCILLKCGSFSWLILHFFHLITLGKKRIYQNIVGTFHVGGLFVIILLVFMGILDYSVLVYLFQTDR